MPLTHFSGFAVFSVQNSMGTSSGIFRDLKRKKNHFSSEQCRFQNEQTWLVVRYARGILCAAYFRKYYWMQLFHYSDRVCNIIFGTYCANFEQQKPLDLRYSLAVSTDLINFLGVRLYECFWVCLVILSAFISQTDKRERYNNVTQRRGIIEFKNNCSEM